jgi:ribose 5-phosphate isomerase B
VHIAIAADHNGTAYKSQIVALLTARGHTVDDRGATPGDGEVDYPPLCADLCRLVVAGAADRGIVVGGSGQGEAIACNKVPGVRAGLCQDLFGAGISRGNNDSNVLVLGAKVVTLELAGQIVSAWLDTPFKGGVHQRRIDQITAMERGHPLT